MKPLSCEQVRDLLPDWDSRTPSGDSRTAMAAHLEGCANCRAEAALLAGLRRSLPAVPATLEWRVLNATRRPPARRWLTVRQLAVAATLAVAVLGGSLLIEVAARRAGDGPAPAITPGISAGVLLPGLEDPILVGRSVLPSLTEAELESLLARMES